MDALPRLLIVDDTESSLVMLETIFKNLQIHLIRALSGAEALEKSRNTELALAIIDVRMPDMDGYELAVRLNEARDNDKVPVIFLTANYPSGEEVFKGYASGAVDYLAKPFTGSVLLSKVRVFLTLFRQKQKIQSTARELEYSVQQLKELSENMEQVREAERLSISRELHDELGQALTAVKIDLGMVQKQIADQKAAKKLADAIDLVSSTIQATQRITNQLRPDIIDDLGLASAIDWYVGEFKKRTGLQVIQHIQPDIPISAQASLILFRILQESLTNIARHADASLVEIRMNGNFRKLHFTVSDNGVGIAHTQEKSRQSFGIIGMKERADSIGGRLHILNREAGGTMVKVTFPINS